MVSPKIICKPSFAPSALSKSYTQIELEFVQQYLSKDLRKIINQCLCFDLNEKKSGLCNLHILLRRKDVILSEKEVFKIRDLLANFFEEEISEIYRIFLEVLYDFLQLFSNFLTGWIEVIFLKLFTKLSSATLPPSLKTYIKRLLASLSFCYTANILFQSFCLSYSIHTFIHPKSKSETPAFEYLQELLRLLEPDDFLITDYMESFIVKLTKALAIGQYTMRKNIQDILSVLYDLNPATFNSILSRMQYNLQETLTRSIRCQWDKAIENDSLSPRKTFPMLHPDCSLKTKYKSTSVSEHNLSEILTPLTNTSHDNIPRQKTRTRPYTEKEKTCSSLSPFASTNNSGQRNIPARLAKTINTIRNKTYSNSNMIPLSNLSIHSLDNNTHFDCSTPSKLPIPVLCMKIDSNPNINTKCATDKSTVRCTTLNSEIKINNKLYTELTPSKIPVSVKRDKLLNDPRVSSTPNPTAPHSLIHRNSSILMKSYTEWKKPKNEKRKISKCSVKTTLNFTNIEVNEIESSAIIELNNDELLDSDFSPLMEEDMQTISHNDTDSELAFSIIDNGNNNSKKDYFLTTNKSSSCRDVRHSNSNDVSISNLLARLLIKCSDTEKINYLCNCRNEIISLLVDTMPGKQIFEFDFLPRIQLELINFSYKLENEELLMSLHLIYLVSVLDNDSLIWCTDNLIYLLIYSHTISSHNVKLKVEELFRLIIPYTCIDVLVRALISNINNIAPNSLSPLKFVLQIINILPYDQLLAFLPNIVPLLVELFSDKASIQNAVLPCLVSLINKFDSSIQKYLINLSQEQIRLIAMYAN